MARRRRIRRGDVYVVTYAFPHERGTGAGASDVEKERPVVIVQNDEDNDNDLFGFVRRTT